MKDELRGYIFMGFALMCFCTRCLGGVAAVNLSYDAYHNGASIYVDALTLLTAVFIIVSIFFMLKAKLYGEKTVRTDPEFLRNGEHWRMDNCFDITASVAELQQAEDALRYTISIEAKNLLAQMKQIKNDLEMRVTAIAETGTEKVELQALNPTDFVLQTGVRQQYNCIYQLPIGTERVLMQVTVQKDGQQYQQQYEFYPAHYRR